MARVNLRYVLGVLIFIALWQNSLFWLTSSWQHSYYFRPDVAAVRRLSLERELAANITLAQFAKRHPVESLGLGDTCVVVVCAPRPLNYVGPLLASMVRALNVSHPRCFQGPKSGCPVQIMLFDTTNGANKALNGLIERVAPVVRCGSCTLKELNWTDRQIWHYALALNYSMSRNCSSVTLMEDDIVASPDLFERLALTAARFDRKHWALVKLFQTDFWNNWERRDAPGLLAVPLLCSTLLLLLAKACFRLERTSFCWLLLLLTVVGALTPWMIGKQYFFNQQPRPFSLSRDCAGSLANFYTIDMAAALGLFLSEAPSKPVDLLLCDFADAMQRDMAVYGGGVQHVGLVSSSPEKWFNLAKRVAYHKLDPDFKDPSFRWT